MACKLAAIDCCFVPGSSPQFKLLACMYTLHEFGLDATSH